MVTMQIILQTAVFTKRRAYTSEVDFRATRVQLLDTETNCCLLENIKQQNY